MADDIEEIAHGIRRFEFMLHDGETDDEAEAPAFVHALLAPFVPHPERVAVIRSCSCSMPTSGHRCGR